MLEAELDISFNTLKKSRLRLSECSLISFVTKNGSSEVFYTLSNFDQVSDDVVDQVADEVNHSDVDTSSNFDQVTNEVGNEVSNEVDPDVYNVRANIKLNKTKQYKEKDKKKSPTGETPPKKQKRFIPPTYEEVKKYCEERGDIVDAMRFTLFYTSKGWMVGKSKMVDWKAAVRTWEIKEKEGRNNARSKGGQGADTRQKQYGGY